MLRYFGAVWGVSPAKDEKCRFGALFCLFLRKMVIFRGSGLLDLNFIANPTLG
jgi:hypothetical protein